MSDPEVGAELVATQVLRLQPGDILVVKSERRLTVEQATALREHVKERIPDHEVLVIPPDLDLAVLRQEEQ